MVGRRNRGDWVIQPETWKDSTNDPAQMYYVPIGNIFGFPLTVSTDWYNTAGDQMERYREMEMTEKAVCTRGDIWLHLVPQPQESWQAVLGTQFSTVVVLRITRWTQTPNDQNEVMSPTFVDFREAAFANDEYVWQRQTHFTNLTVYDSVSVSTNRIGPLNIVRQIPVMARYQRRLGGLDNMYLFVQWSVFHGAPAWNYEEPYTLPQARLAVTPYLRTFVTG